MEQPEKLAKVKTLDKMSNKYTSVLSQVLLLFPDLKPPILSVPHFSQAFMSSSTILNADGLHSLTIDDLINGFNSSCTNILDQWSPTTRPRTTEKE